VLIEWKARNYTFTVDGKPLPEDEAEVLKRDVFSESWDWKTKELLPGKAIKTGEEWKIDVAKVHEKMYKDEAGPYKFDLEKAVSPGKMTKKYEKDNCVWVSSISRSTSQSRKSI